MIFWSYTVATGAILVVSLFPLLDFLAVYGGPLTEGYVYTIACYLAFLAAYAIGNLTVEQRSVRHTLAGQERMRQLAYNLPIVKNRYVAALAICALIGATVSVLQIYTSIGFDQYFALLARGGQSYETARGSTILIDSSEGGLPGYLKILNVNCTLAALIVINLLSAGHKFQGFRSRVLLAIILACFILRNFIYMDRLALLALIPATIQLLQAGSRQARRTLLFCFALIALLAQVQSMRRGYSFGAFTFFVLYVQSGMVNTSLMIDSLVGPHTYGFASILSPIYWIFKAAGSNLIDVNADGRFSWVWNAAQNAYGTLFLDFGWFALPVLAIFGFVAKRLDRNSSVDEQISPCQLLVRARIRAIVAYAALSTMFVPAYEGLEYWVLLLGIIAATRLEHRNALWCFQPEPRDQQTPRQTRQLASGLKHSEFARA